MPAGDVFSGYGAGAGGVFDSYGGAGGSVFSGYDPLYGGQAGVTMPASSPAPWASWATQANPSVPAYAGNQYPGYTSGQSAYASPYQGDMFAYGQKLQTGDAYSSYDPIPKINADVTYAPLSVQFGANMIMGPMDAWLSQQAAAQAAQGGSSGTGSNPGYISSPTDPKWANVNQWNSQIQTAVNQVQQQQGVFVPPNVVKAFMQMESQGVMPSGPNMAGAGGLMQVTPGSMGGSAYDYTRMNTDPAYSIWAGVNELALRYKDAKAQDPTYGWPNVAVGYFAGHYVPTGATDAYNTSDQQYMTNFNQNMTELGNSGYVQGQTAQQAAPGTKQFNSIWGGFDAPITQEYGMTDFARQQLASGPNNEYADTSAYSRDGTPVGHAGVDVGVSAGTALHTPVAGKVTLVGSQDGQHFFYTNQVPDGNGGFTDSPGMNMGELAITLPNQDVLILGHMSQINVKVGDTVNPGDFVGYSGQNNGAHVHVEYRQWAPGQGTGPDYSGYLTVDPRQALGGNFTGSYGAQQGFGPAAPTAAGGAMNDFLRAVDQGQPVSTSMLPTQGGFHDWLYNQMMGLPQPGDQNGAALAGSWVWSDGTTHSLPSSGSAGGGIVNEAKQYLNVKYVWGGIPTKTQDPFQTGWDCSGFTYFMDQKYGDGTLPQGSHYQYQYAQQTGRLFTDTSQLKPGDLVFFNTGDTQGAGADLNPAGHVGIYLGNDQIISAMNPSMGTVLSSFSGFSSPFIGAMHMSSWK